MIADFNVESLYHMPQEDLIRLCTSLTTELSNALEIKRFHTELLEDFRAQKARQQRLLSNKSMNGNLKVLLMKLDDKFTSTDDFSPVDVFELERETGLSHSTVSRLLRLLQDSYHAIARKDTFQERKKEQRKIVVNKISVQPTEKYLQAPESLTATPGGQVRAKRKKDACPSCGSRDTQRIYHLLCNDCGEESSNYPEDFVPTQQHHDNGGSADQNISDLIDNELIQLERVGDDQVGDLPGQELPGQLDQVERVEFADPCDQVGDLPGQELPGQLDQVERVQIGDFFFNEGQALFIERWRIVSHDPRFIPRSVQAYNDVVALAVAITTTEQLQTEFDAEYARLTEYAKGMGRQATPPRLYNLRKRLPDLLASQNQRESAAAPVERRRLPNWTGQAPPELDYSLVLEMAAQRDKRRSNIGNITWKNEDAAEYLKRVRHKNNELE